MPHLAAAESLAAARLGQGWAFERIYSTLAAPVRRYLESQGVPDSDASTQEVFLRAFRTIGRFEGDAEALRSWIFTIAHNLLIDERRSATRSPRGTSTVREREPADRPDIGSEDALDAVVEHAQLRFLLDSLPRSQRHVIALRFLADLPLADVAEVVGCSVQAVKALQHRGLAHLRSLLEHLPADTASSEAVPSFTPS